MKTRRVRNWCETGAVWAGLCLMAVLVFGESRSVWRSRDLCAREQAQTPAPAFNPADWQR